MDKDLERNLKKILVVKNEAGDTIINPDAVEVIKNAGFYILSESLTKKFLHESYELGKLKKLIKENERENNTESN